ISTQMDINKDGTGEPLNVKVLFGQFNLADKPINAGVVKDSLGQEIDVTATLQYNKSLSFMLGYATLSDGDFFTSAGGYNADSGNMKMVVFDTKLKF
ncbi:MAG: hypothetical protein HY762_02310, partial [Planctomycetes bacterium]|nr:hypothetical protein [Planctomycetota bacterium]